MIEEDQEREGLNPHADMTRLLNRYVHHPSQSKKES